jgi:hypothetical protein
MSQTRCGQAHRRVQLTKTDQNVVVNQGEFSLQPDLARWLGIALFPSRFWHDFAQTRSPPAASLAEVRGFLGEFKFSVKIARLLADMVPSPQTAGTKQGVAVSGDESLLNAIFEST